MRTAVAFVPSPYRCAITRREAKSRARSVDWKETQSAPRRRSRRAGHGPFAGGPPPACYFPLYRAWRRKRLASRTKRWLIYVSGSLLVRQRGVVWMASSDGVASAGRRASAGSRRPARAYLEVAPNDRLPSTCRSVDEPACQVERAGLRDCGVGGCVDDPDTARLIAQRTRPR